MADGFYTNEDDDPGCFGGYGSDGAWAYADACGAEATQPGYGSAPNPGSFGALASQERRTHRFAGFFRSGGSGGYGPAA